MALVDPACVRARLFLIAIGGLAAAALGDVAVEAAVQLRFFGGQYHDCSHQTIVPVAVLTGALMLAHIGWTRMNAHCDAAWFVSVARDATMARVRVQIVATTLLASLIALAMERAEQALGGGLPYGGVPLESVAGLTIAGAFVLSAMTVVVSLAAGLHALVAAFDLVARTLGVALVWLLDVRNGGGVPQHFEGAAGGRCSARSVHLSRSHADRAPPQHSLVAS